jgi:hypothetical protein
MSAPAMQAIANITLSAATASVAFSNIPQGYRDLKIISTIALSGDISTYMQFNNDVGANYNSVRILGNGSSATSYANSNSSTALAFGISNATAQTTLTTNVIFEVLDYSITNKHKSTISRVNDAASESMVVAGRWSSTSAITSIQCIAGSGTFSTGSTFTLYGVLA